MKQWTVGSVTVTAIVESEAKTSPRFLFKALNRDDVLAIAAEAPWLNEFVDAEGYLLQRIQCLVIDTGTERIAVDTCVGNDKHRVNPGWNRLQLPFLADMAAAGYPPESIDVVVCTHLHVDHIGWNTRLVDGRWVPTFPNARYVFVAREVDHWRGEGPTRDEDLFGDSVAPVLEAGLADLVCSDHVICPEVRLDPTPGHTPGHVSVVIESGGRTAVITGDMIHTPLQIARVELSSDFDTDGLQAAQTRREFLERYRDNALVIGTHWGGVGSGQVHHDASGAWKVVAPGSV
jgi:glyoxylase-like metal-dependent hydrolase (beta-lactamase superfamily II)